jgi:hypothetical protein
MCVVYPIVICHIVRGNRSKFLILLCLILMLNNIGGIFAGYSLYELTVLKHISAPLIWMLGVGKALDYGSFCMSHYLLAVTYREMATNTQLLLKGEDARIKTTGEKILHCLLLFLNVAAPFYYGVILIIFRTH